MALDEFLKALGDCPDDELSTRFNFRDNYVILVKADFGGVAVDLDASEKWTYDPGATMAMEAVAQGKPFRVYLDETKTIPIQVLFDVPFLGTKVMKHAGDVGYNMCFMVNEYIQGEAQPSHEIHPMRRLANAVKELVLYARGKGIPVCLPKTKPLGREEGFVSFP